MTTATKERQRLEREVAELREQDAAEAQRRTRGVQLHTAEQRLAELRHEEAQRVARETVIGLYVEHAAALADDVAPEFTEVVRALVERVEQQRAKLGSTWEGMIYAIGGAFPQQRLRSYRATPEEHDAFVVWEATLPADVREWVSFAFWRASNPWGGPFGLIPGGALPPRTPFLPALAAALAYRAQEQANIQIELDRVAQLHGGNDAA